MIIILYLCEHVWYIILFIMQCSYCMFKGKFPQTTMWIGWVESNFRNPTVKVWADLDNPFKRSDYAKLCMSPSLDGTLPEYVISQEDNSPLTLYIYFQNFHFFFFSWISIVLLIKFIHKCMHIHLSPNIPKYKRTGKIHFHVSTALLMSRCYRKILMPFKNGKTLGWCPSIPASVLSWDPALLVLQ